MAELEDQGHRIVVAHVPVEDQRRHSFLERLLAVTSPWGLPDDLWEWTAYEGDQRLASDIELSESAAVEGARHWIRVNR